MNVDGARGEVGLRSLTNENRAALELRKLGDGDVKGVRTSGQEGILQELAGAEELLCGDLLELGSLASSRVSCPVVLLADTVAIVCDLAVAIVVVHVSASFAVNCGRCATVCATAFGRDLSCHDDCWVGEISEIVCWQQVSRGRSSEGR